VIPARVSRPEPSGHMCRTTGAVPAVGCARNWTSLPCRASPVPDTREPAPTWPTDSLAQRIVAEASAQTVRYGWSSITMAKLAGAIGISRQSIYNEVGSKSQLAHAMVATESLRFLDAVYTELGLGSNLQDAISRAAFRAFQMAESDSMLRAVVASAQGGNNELLPLVTTQSQPILGSATDVIVARLTDLYPRQVPSEPELRIACGAIVRLVLSYVAQPVGSPAACATEITWIADRFLARESDA
jgi:AcrR family transcriptional regulator